MSAPHQAGYPVAEAERPVAEAGRPVAEAGRPVTDMEQPTGRTADQGDQVLDRTAAFAAGPPRFPGQVMSLAVAGFVVLGLGGVVLDHVFPGPVGAAATATTNGNYPPALPAGLATLSTPRTTVMAQLPAPVPALMGLQHLRGAQAPPFALVDQYGRTATLRNLRGKVVVLSFFDAACDDICGVLETELSQAYQDLGPDRSQVALVTVNTDPLALTLTPRFPAEEGTTSSVPGWRFLTGSLARIAPVWTAYGVSIEVQRRDHAVSHNDLLYFIDPAGRLRLEATPYANESASGGFSLPHATEVEWATGIAAQARSLMGPQP